MYIHIYIYNMYDCLHIVSNQGKSKIVKIAKGVYMYSMYMMNVYTFLDIHINSFCILFRNIYIRVYIIIFWYMYKQKCMYLYLYKYMCKYAYTHEKYTYIHMNAYEYVCMLIYIFISHWHLCIHITFVYEYKCVYKYV